MSLRRRPSLSLVLAAGCFALAFAQRPGTLVADTKVNLYVDPGRFLGDVASAWTPSGSLGHVFAGQYGGYLFPMGPFFAAGHAVGAPMWVVHRLWIGALLALSAWGMVRLLDALVGPRRTAAHAAAAALYVVNPYVAVYLDRTSIALLAYAALPWMLLAVHRALREPRAWWWPAAFALLLTSTGGGVNVAVTGWLLVAPVLLAAYERVWGGVGRGALRPFALRLGATCAVANAWWLVPLVVHAHYGLNFLPFTEQPGTIWSTTSLSESLRLMGFWTSYIRVGYGGVVYPFSGHGHALLFDAPIVVATLLVPALALAGFVWTRRWRYGPFFLALTLVGAVIMAAGWPEGTPLRKGLTFTYNHVQALQFLRTTYKAGPLVALGLAALGGAAFAAVWARARWRPVLAVGAAALAAAAAWPLTSGRAPDRQLAFGVPASYRALGRDLDRRGDDSRVLSLPGQLFAFHRWGGTIDDVLPALTHRPVATRYLVPYADLRADDLLWATDSLISQERAVPGQLPPLLDLLGVGDLVLAADGDRGRSGELGVLEARAQLGRIAQRAAWASRDLVGASPAAGRLGGVRRVPRVERFATATGGLVRVVARGGPTIVDGDGEGLAQLAAFGALHPDRPLRYAADLDARALRAAARTGASFVISDSNRRRAFVSSRLRGNAGPTLPPDQRPSEDGTMLDPFASRGAAAQTIAEVRGVKALTAPASPQVTQFPEHRPFAALDGDPRTAWLADRFLAPARHRITVRFRAPRDVRSIELMPYDDSRATVRSVAIGGRVFTVHRGWNRLALGLRHVSSLTVRLVDVRRPRVASAGGGGLRELRIPGVRVQEALRPPVLLERALRGADLRRSALTYLLERTTAPAPYREGRLTGAMGAGLLRDARDPEAQLRRVISPPVRARWRADAWVRVSADTADAELDRLAGTRGGGAAWSSARFEGAPRYRASGALDGTRGRAWLGEWIRGRPAWLSWRTPRPTTIRRLRVVPPRERVRVPTVVRLRAADARGAGPRVASGVAAGLPRALVRSGGARSTPPLRVGRDGVVRLPRPLRGRAFRLDVLDAAFRGGANGRVRQRRAVGIGELRGAGLRLSPPRTGAVDAPCGAAAIVVGDRRVALRVRSSLAALDAGAPLRATACGPPVALGTGKVVVRGATGAFTVDQLRLATGTPPRSITGGRVVDAGKLGDGRRTGVRVRVAGPSWLVLGESYDAGWRATCDGRDLGAPAPLQGYANGWPVGRGCRDVSFAFAPNRVIRAGYAVSLAGVLALLALLVVRRRRPVLAPLGDLAVAPATPWPARRALIAAAIAAPTIGFVFSLRAGAASAPLIALVLWRGVSDRALIALAGVLLAVGVPVAYALAGFDGRHGFNTYYAVDHRAGHWLAVAAVIALGVALARTLAAQLVRPGPAPQPRRDEDLDDEVAREPRELPELA